MMNTIKIVSALAVGMLMTTPALADPPTLDPIEVDGAKASQTEAAGLRTVRVPYGDLNVTSQAGVKTLTGRISRAVDEVCGSRVDDKDLRAIRDQRNCQNEALFSAMVQVDELIGDRKVAAAK